MTQKGEHTWDLNLDYQCCPNCGCINESREAFHLEKNLWVKHLVCKRCSCGFMVERARKATFGPIFGAPQPPEITWE